MSGSDGAFLFCILVAVVWILGDILGLTGRKDDRWDE